MPVVKSNNFDHPDTWIDILLEHKKEIRFNDIRIYEDLNLPMVMWSHKSYTVTYFKGKVTMEYSGHGKCEVSYKEFLLMFV